MRHPVSVIAALGAAVFSATVAASAAPRFGGVAAPSARFVDDALRLPGALDAKSHFSDPVIPGPKIRRPTSPSCTVTLLTNQPFENFTPVTGPYAPPPSCAGPWSKVIFEWHVHISGVQYDRLGAVWLDGTEIFHFTTSEPPGPTIDWSVEKDVTEYANTLQTANNFTVSLGNLVNSTYTGIYYVTAKLVYYKADRRNPAPAVPDVVDAISQYPTTSPPWFNLTAPSQQASATLSLPTNIERAELEVYTTGHGCDEFWYAQESTAYEQTIGQTCGGTAYREIDVWLDGNPVGVVAPFPYLYTGAIDPILWLPITGHDALDIPPYRVDLSPWVGVLTNGQQHTIGVSVYNNFGYWVCDADLLLNLDHGKSATSGRVTRVVTGPAQIEHYNEKHLGPNGGHASYEAHHFLRAEGYVDTSHGRVYNRVREDLVFDNHQRFVNPSGPFRVASGEQATTHDTVTAGTRVTRAVTVDTYPLLVDLTSNVDITQGFYETVDAQVGPKSSSSYSQEAISAKAVASKPTQTADHFVLLNSNGYCFGQLLTASDGVLTGNSKLKCQR